MGENKSRKVIINLTDELSESELEMLRRNAESMEQSLGAHIAWILFRANRENKDVKKAAYEFGESRQMTETANQRRFQQWPRSRRCERREELQIWQEAYDYYMNRGWDNLAMEADKQIKRIAHELAVDFINSGRNALFHSDRSDEH